MAEEAALCMFGDESDGYERKDLFAFGCIPYCGHSDSPEDVEEAGEAGDLPSAKQTSVRHVSD